MALIDLWKQRVAGHDFTTGNLSAVNSDNYSPHNSPDRPAATEGVTPLTLDDLDSEAHPNNVYFKNVDIPDNVTDVKMKNRNIISESFGTLDFDGLNSIIAGSNTETGYIHHFTGKLNDGSVPGFFRDNTGIKYDTAAAQATYTQAGGLDTESESESDDEGTDDDTTVETQIAVVKAPKKQAAPATPLTYEEWVYAQGPEIQNYTYPKAAYAAYRYAFLAGGR
jgi:hypothetical protein